MLFKWGLSLACLLSQLLQVKAKSEITVHGEIDEVYTFPGSLSKNTTERLALSSPNYLSVSANPGKIQYLDRFLNFETVDRVLFFGKPEKPLTCALYSSKSKPEDGWKYQVAATLDQPSQPETLKHFYQKIDKNTPKLYLFQGSVEKHLFLIGSSYDSGTNVTSFYIYCLEWKQVRDDWVLLSLPKASLPPKVAKMTGKFLVNEDTRQVSDFFAPNDRWKHQFLLALFNPHKSTAPLSDDPTNGNNQIAFIMFDAIRHDLNVGIRTCLYELDGPTKQTFDVRIHFHEGKEKEEVFPREKNEYKRKLYPEIRVVGFGRKDSSSSPSCFYQSVILTYWKDVKKDGWREFVVKDEMKVQIKTYIPVPNTSIKNNMRPFCIMWQFGYQEILAGNRKDQFFNGLGIVVFKFNKAKGVNQPRVQFYFSSNKENKPFALMKKKSSKVTMAHPGFDALIEPSLLRAASLKDINSESPLRLYKTFMTIKYKLNNQVVLLDYLGNPSGRMNTETVEMKSLYLRRINLFKTNDVALKYKKSEEEEDRRRILADDDAGEVERKESWYPADFMNKKDPPKSRLIVASGGIIQEVAWSNDKIKYWPQTLTAQFVKSQVIPQPNHNNVSQEITILNEDTSPLSKPKELTKMVFVLAKDYMSIVKTPKDKTNETQLNIFVESFADIKLTHSDLIGNNLTFKLKNDPKNIRLIDQRFMKVKFNRIDTITNNSQTDEIFWTSRGAIFEEHNRGIGYLECSQRNEYTGSLVMDCRSETFNITRSEEKIQVVEVMDYEKACSFILIKAKSLQKDKETYLFYYFNYKKKQIEKMNIEPKIDLSSKTTMGCQKRGDFTYIYIMEEKKITGNLSIHFYRLDDRKVFNKIRIKSRDIKEFNDNLIKYDLELLDYTISGKEKEEMKVAVMDKFNTIVIFTQYFLKLKDFEKTSVRGNIREKTTEMRDSPYTNTTSPNVCLMKGHYLVSPKDNNIDKGLWIYPGQFYSSNAKNEKLSTYYNRYKIDLRKIGLASYSRIRCHMLQEGLDVFTVIGKSKDPGSKTLITTFVAQKNLYGRVYHQVSTHRVFQEILMWDDGIASVYLRIKEMKGSNETYRIYAPPLDKKLLQIHFGKTFSEKGKTFILQGSNMKNTFEYKIDVKWAKLKKLQVTPPKDLYHKPKDYKLSELTQQISGPIRRVFVHPPNSHIQVLKKRVEVLNTSFILNRTEEKTPLESTQILSKPFLGGIVFYVASKKLFYIFANNTVKSTHIAVFKPEDLRIKVFVDRNDRTQLGILARDSNSYGRISYWNIAENKPVSGFVTRGFRKNAIGEPISVYFKEGADGPLGFIAFEPPNMAAFYVNKKKGGFIRFTNSLVSKLSREIRKKYICQNIYSGAFYTKVNHIVICSYLREISPSLSVATLGISYFDEEFVPQGDLIPMTTDSSLEKESLKMFACAFSNATTISCVNDLYEKFYIILAKKSDCPDKEFLCIDFEKTKIEKKASLDKQFSFKVWSVYNSGAYFAFFTTKTQFNGLSNQLILLFYKEGTSSLFYEYQFGTISRVDTATAGFMLDSNNKFYVGFVGKKYDLKILSLNEMIIRVSASQYNDLKPSKLVFQSTLLDNENIEVPFTTIFKERVKTVIKEPPGFFKKYLWAVLLTTVLIILIGSLLTFYFVRRARLMRELAAKDDTIITDLREFYFHDAK